MLSSASCAMPTSMKQDDTGLGLTQTPTSPHQDLLVGEEFSYLQSDCMSGNNMMNSNVDWNLLPDLSSDNLNNEPSVMKTDNCGEMEGGRTRFYSGSWAPSPYSALDNLEYVQRSPLPDAQVVHPFSSPLQNKNLNIKPDFDRQSSLSMAIEVLGHTPVEEEQIHSPLPTPFLDDSDIIPHPSLSYINTERPSTSNARQRNISWGGECTQTLTSDPRARSASEDASAYNEYNVDVDALLRETLGVSTLTEEEDQSASSNTNNNNNNVTNTEAAECSSNSQSTSSQEPLLIESLLNNLHVPQAVVPASVEPSTYVVVETSTIDISQLEESNTTQSSVKKQVIDLTEEAPSTSSVVPSLSRTPSYTRKRTRNNQACRESRKKKKMQLTESEEQVTKLSSENEVLRRQINQLEVEVRETRQTLLFCMTGKKQAAQ